MTLFEIDSLPSGGVDGYRFMEAVGKRFFALIHDASVEATYLYLRDEDGAVAASLENVLPGLVMRISRKVMGFGESKAVSAYRMPKEGQRPLPDIALQGIREGLLAAVFLPCGEKDIIEAKLTAETALSNKRVKATKSFAGGFLAGRSSSSTHMDLYDESEERKLLIALLEDVDDAILSGMPMFRVLLVTAQDSNAIHDRLVENSVALYDVPIAIPSIDNLGDCLDSRGSMVMGPRHAMGFISFNWTQRISYPISTFIGAGSAAGQIALGTYSKDGVAETGKRVAIDPSALNLGMAVAGLPGSGKTREAMAVISQLERRRTAVAVISPTDEWDGFAMRTGMRLIRLGFDNLPINFFANPSKTGIEKFYEDLSLLISTASNSGPYQNPMEKCLLNAFKHAYGKHTTPNPTFVYGEIESSIIRFHGKVGNTGVRYTKHGENIKAALENLRHILANPNYSATEGADISRIVSEGAVFSLSRISNASKPYLYALLLNQLYAIADSFDTNGDGELRLLICIEEAQTIFGKGLENAATSDLVRRMQDFRKRGIGMVLVVHSVSDLDADIRRLCQNKLYFKQAADIAPLAAKDLVFTYAEQEDVVLKLKHLDSRICAADFVRKERGGRVSGDSVFIRTLDYGEDSAMGGHEPVSDLKVPEANREISMSIAVTDMRAQKARIASWLSVYFLGEEMERAVLIDGGCRIGGALEGRQYTARITSEADRVIGSCAFTARRDVHILISDSGLSEIRPAAP